MGVSTRNGDPVVVAFVGAATLALLAVTSSGLTGQQLPIKTGPLPGEIVICRSDGVTGGAGPVGTVAVDSAEALRLANAATQAMILGDLAGALDHLDRALVLDPAAADAIYLRARILQEQGAVEPAADALCAYLALRPDGSSAREVRRRLDEARDAGVGARITESYRRALALEFEGRLDEAEAAFTEFLSVRPGAPPALYNRGVVRAALGWNEAARADLERYAQLDPTPGDARDVQRFLAAAPRGADPVAIADRTATGSTAVVGPRSGTAFAVGALLPGGGQFYTGRPALGVAVTALAGGALAAGFLYERTTVRCLDATIERDCPEELVASRDTSRPFLGPAALAAVGVMLGAAIEASLHARRSSTDGSGSSAAPAGDSGARLGFSGDVQYDGGVLHLGLVRLRF